MGSTAVTKHDWRKDEDAYLHRLDIEAIRLQREIVRNGGAIYFQQIEGDGAKPLLKQLDDSGARYSAYPFEDGDYQLFSNQPDQGEELHHIRIADLADLLFDAVNTPRGMDYITSNDWGYNAEITIEEAETLLEMGDHLARELWGEDALSIPIGDKGTGDWPKPPNRTNPDAAPIGRRLKGTHINLTAEMIGERVKVTGKFGPRWSRRWEICDREYYYRVKREVSKAHCEMSRSSMYWMVVDDETEVQRLIKRQKQRAYREDNPKRISRIIYPFEDGDTIRFAIVHNQRKDGGELVPTDRTQAMKLFDPWLRTPDGMRTRPTESYGGKYMGAEGDSRQQVIYRLAGIDPKDQPKKFNLQLITEEPPAKVAEVIGIEMNANLSAYFDIPEPEELIMKLTAGLPDLRTRGGRGALHAFLDWWIDTCSPFGDTYSKDKEVSLSRLQNHDGMGQKGERKPPEPEPRPLMLADWSE